jgi:hypothetical protein
LRIDSHVSTMRAYSRVTYGGRSRLIRAGACAACRTPTASDRCAHLRWR